MKTFGEFIADACRQLHLAQDQLAARIKNEQGRAISLRYLNIIERSLRPPPRNFLLKQFIAVLKLDRELVYFYRQELPPGVDLNKLTEERVRAAVQPLRQLSTGTGR
jgi:transcriptional regulator with XRE-family HTH domain